MRKSEIKQEKEMLFFGIVLLTLVILLSHPIFQRFDDYYDTSEVIVFRVIDGDTFELEDGTRIRLIGIDTPESVSPDESKNTVYGTIASDFTKSLIEGRTVTLEYDIDLTDEYGRTLAYVYLENRQMLQEVLLKEGYARTMTISPNTRYEEIFRTLEGQAMYTETGFWADYYKEN